MQLRPQWVVYRLVQRGDKTTKVLCRFSGEEASSTDPGTWGTFDEAQQAAASGRFPGIGYVLNSDDPYTGIDLDKVRNPKTGALTPSAQAIIDRLSSYTEISQSGLGVHIIVKATKPGVRCRIGGVEMYDDERFFVMTGAHLEGTPDTIEDRQGAINALYAELFPPPPPPPEGSTPPQRVNVDDDELLRRMFASKNGAALKQLWDGDTSAHPSHSEADAALCMHLAFWTDRDAARIDLLFRRSGLFREKWDRVGVRTIEWAIGLTTKGYKLPSEPHLHLTDLTNAERFVERHGDDVRYCVSWRSWLVWDGRRWRKDDTQAAQLLAQETVKAMYTEAAAETDTERRKLLSRHAVRSEAANKVAAMLASAEPMLPMRPTDFDTDPWVLNVLNGTMDLRTGELRPHRREDLITKLAPVEYDASARRELWEQFVRVSTKGDDELSAYLQRCAGYTLTGRATEFSVFFVHGPSWSGKSKFLGALRDVLGVDYAVQTAFKTFLATRQGGGASNDIADMKGARMVLAIEANKGERFNEAMLKQMTGGDDMRARQLYQNNEQFKPQMKIWLASNHKPRVSDDDGAMWNRMNIVEFTHVMPENDRDLNLGDKLALPANRSGVLAWAMRGCLAWQRDGLKPPPIVRDATRRYREEMDPLGDFFDAHCVFGADAWVNWFDLRGAYISWAQRNDVRHPLPEEAFRRRLRDHGCEPKVRRNQRGWLGVQLAREEVDADAERLTTREADVTGAEQFR